MRAGGGVMRMRWKEHDGKRGELGGKRGKTRGSFRGRKDERKQK